MSTRRVLLLIILPVLSAVYLFPLITHGVALYDEGIILAGADRILQGQTPHTDYWTLYPPGQFYVVAFLFKIFGTSMLVERIYDILIRAGIPLIGYLIVRRLGVSEIVALAGWAFSLAWIGYIGFPLYPVYPALLLILLGMYLLLRYLDTHDLRWLHYSPVLLVVAALFRHDLAASAATAAFVMLLFGAMTDGKSRYTEVLHFSLGLMLAALPLALLILRVFEVEYLIENLIMFPVTVFPQYRELPYPSVVRIGNAPFFVVPVLLLGGFISSVVLAIGSKSRNTATLGLFLFSLLGLLFLNQVRVRSDLPHLLPASVVALLILPPLLSMLWRTLSSGAGRLLTAVLVVVLLLVYARPIAYRMWSFPQGYLLTAEKPAIERAVYASMPADLRAVLKFIEKNTSEDEAIFVGVKNHDQFIVNDVIIYFLAARRYPTRYHELHPGLTNTVRIQEEIIEELDSSSVKVVVLAPGYWYEPNLTSIDSKIDLLDNYILGHFEMERRYGVYEIWVNKS